MYVEVRQLVPHPRNQVEEGYETVHTEKISDCDDKVEVQGAVADAVEWIVSNREANKQDIKIVLVEEVTVARFTKDGEPEITDPSEAFEEIGQSNE